MSQLHRLLFLLMIFKRNRSSYFNLTENFKSINALNEQYNFLWTPFPFFSTYEYVLHLKRNAYQTLELLPPFYVGHWCSNKPIKYLHPSSPLCLLCCLAFSRSIVRVILPSFFTLGGCIIKEKSKPGQAALLSEAFYLLNREAYQHLSAGWGPIRRAESRRDEMERKRASGHLKRNLSSHTYTSWEWICVQLSYQTWHGYSNSC